MNPSLKDQLKDWKRKHQESTPRKKKPSQKTERRKSEQLSESDIKSLMGMNMPRYQRGRGGAIRQK